MEEEFRAGGVGYGEFKRRVVEAIDAYFTSFRARREALAREPDAVDSLLQDGAEQARVVTLQTKAHRCKRDRGAPKRC
jgi:tryptophanyl-tRNA synthetase